MSCTAEAFPSGLVSPGRVRLAADPRGASVALYLDEGTVFDAAKPRERTGAPLRVVDLEHHRRDQFAALRDQRVVGRQLREGGREACGPAPSCLYLEDEVGLSI